MWGGGGGGGSGIHSIRSFIQVYYIVNVYVSACVLGVLLV